MFWGKKLDRERTIGTDRWEGQKVNWGQSMEDFEWQFKKSDHFHSVVLRQRSEDNPRRGPHFWSWVPGLPQFPPLPSTLCSLECGPAERCITPFSGPSSPRGGRSRTGWSSSWYLIVQGLLKYSVWHSKALFDQSPCQQVGEGNLDGLPPYPRHRLNPKPRNTSTSWNSERHHSCLSLQRTREAVLVRGDGFALSLAGKGEQAVPWCNI